MSGGALDYLYSRILAGAEHLKEETERIYAGTAGWTDEELTEEDASRQRARLEEVAGLMDDLSKLLRAIEWSWSGDTGFDDWEREYERFSEKWLPQVGTDRQREIGLEG